MVLLKQPVLLETNDGMENYTPCLGCGKEHCQKTILAFLGTCIGYMSSTCIWLEIDSLAMGWTYQHIFLFTKGWTYQHIFLFTMGFVYPSLCFFWSTDNHWMVFIPCFIDCDMSLLHCRFCNHMDHIIHVADLVQFWYSKKTLLAHPVCWLYWVLTPDLGGGTDIRYNKQKHTSLAHWHPISTFSSIWGSISTPDTGIYRGWVLKFSISYCCNTWIYGCRVFLMSDTIYYEAQLVVLAPAPIFCFFPDFSWQLCWGCCYGRVYMASVEYALSL